MYIKIGLITVSALLVMSGCGNKKYVYKNDVHTKKAVSILIDKIESLESQVDTLASSSLCDIPAEEMKEAVIDQKALADTVVSSPEAIFDPVYFGDVNNTQEIVQEDEVIVSSGEIIENEVIVGETIVGEVVESIELTGTTSDMIELKPYKVTAYYVNVRKNKSKVSRSNIVDVLPKDEPVYVSEIDDGWAKIGEDRYLRLSTITPRNR